MLFLETRPSLTPHWKHNRNVAPRPEAETEAESNDTSYQTQREGEEEAEKIFHPLRYFRAATA